jgi:hypothetical protein
LARPPAPTRLADHDPLPVTDDRFTAEVLESERPVLVDFLGDLVPTLPPPEPRDGAPVLTLVGARPKRRLVSELAAAL